MPSLVHYPLDPASRLIRLMCAEYGVPLDVEEVRPWLREADLLELNPAATLPILFTEAEVPVVGIMATIHAVEDLYAPDTVEGLIPADPLARAEMWRLIEWVLIKLNDEVSRYLFEEKIAKRDIRGATPEPSVLRAAKANLSEHMLYFNWLPRTFRCWTIWATSIGPRPERPATGIRASNRARHSGPCSMIGSSPCPPQRAMQISISRRP
jgi:glutathione S-transferase